MSLAPAHPRVTIGVPAYNAAQFLPRTLDSLLAQSYEDIEVLICDNASSDDTGNIARRYAENDKRVRYVRNPQNIGGGRNFIRCVELAKGELFRWSSADDLSAPTFVERCVEVLDNEPEVVQAYPRCILIDENGRELEKYHDGIHTLSDRPRERYLHVMSELRLVNAFYGVMRLDMLRRTGIHGSYRGADLVVQAEIALHGKIKEIPEYLFFRRIHSSAFSSSSAVEKEQFYNPQASNRRGLMRWRLIGEQLRAVFRSPVPVSDKVLLYYDVVRGGVRIRDELAGELVSAAREQFRRRGSVSSTP